MLPPPASARQVALLDRQISIRQFSECQLHVRSEMAFVATDQSVHRQSGSTQNDAMSTKQHVLCYSSTVQMMSPREQYVLLKYGSNDVSHEQHVLLKYGSNDVSS